MAIYPHSFIAFFYSICFFEVFFSFFRKILQKKSPVKPDEYHLHMLTYKYLQNKTQIKNCNFINSIMINFVYFIFILSSFFCKGKWDDM